MILETFNCIVDIVYITIKFHLYVKYAGTDMKEDCPNKKKTYHDFP